MQSSYIIYIHKLCLQVLGDFQEMVLRMLVLRCSNYLHHAPWNVGTTVIRRLYSILIRSENPGSARLCRFHNATRVARQEYLIGAGNVFSSPVRGYAKKGGGKKDKGG